MSSHLSKGGMYTPNLFTHQVKATQEAASVFSAIKGVTGWERKESWCSPAFFY